MVWSKSATHKYHTLRRRKRKNIFEGEEKIHNIKKKIEALQWQGTDNNDDPDDDNDGEDNEDDDRDDDNNKDDNWWWHCIGFVVSRRWRSMQVVAAHCRRMLRQVGNVVSTQSAIGVKKNVEFWLVRSSVPLNGSRMWREFITHGGEESAHRQQRCHQAPHRGATASRQWT